MSCKIRPASAADIDAWVMMRATLWPDTDAVELRTEALAWDDVQGLALIAFDGDGLAVGMAEASVRRDYVNGTGSSPVGFLEAWYVAADHRGRGIGRALIAAVEDWTREQGCSELASDALLDNTASHAAHAACGFGEAERVVYFRKVLDA